MDVKGAGTGGDGTEMGLTSTAATLRYGRQVLPVLRKQRAPKARDRASREARSL